MQHEQTIDEHIDGNIRSAIDQAHEYDKQHDEFAHWYEGDAYMQNTVDSCIEDGYTPEQAFEAGISFCIVAEGKGIRFASEQGK